MTFDELIEAANKHQQEDLPNCHIQDGWLDRLAETKEMKVIGLKAMGGENLSEDEKIFEDQFVSILIAEMLCPEGEE